MSVARTLANPTNADTVEFRVAFDQPVLGVTAARFSVFATDRARGQVQAVNKLEEGEAYLVTVGGVAGDGTLRLDVFGGGYIANMAGTLLSGTFTGGESYDVDHSPPSAPTVTSDASETSNRTPTWTWSGSSAPGDSDSGSGIFRYQLESETDGRANSRTSSQTDDGWVISSDASYTPESPLSLGTHTLAVEERDAAGNWSAPGRFSITIRESATMSEASSACSCASASSAADGHAGRPAAVVLAGILLLLVGVRRVLTQRTPGFRAPERGDPRSAKSISSVFVAFGHLPR